jgi:hypothetical protein
LTAPTDLTQLSDDELAAAKKALAAEEKRREDAAARTALADRRSRNEQLACYASTLLLLFEPRHTCQTLAAPSTVYDPYVCLRCTLLYAAQRASEGDEPVITADLRIEITGTVDVLPDPDAPKRSH